ncbi:EamA family transporter [Candidatus Bipolaricaulota bacterium]|nr:EamA family transporter [Candidatus Bipolaricaulota bacterium]
MFYFILRMIILTSMLYLVFAGVCFGAIGVFVKGIGASISTILLVSIRLISTALLIVTYEGFRGKLGQLRLNSAREFGIGMVGGLIGFALTFSLYLKSLLIIPVSKAVFLHYVAFPLSTIVYSALVLKERVTKYEVVALIGAFVGVILIYNVAIFSPSGSGSLVGYTMAFASGITYSAVILGLKSFARTKTTLQTLFWPALFGGVGLIPVVLFDGVKFDVSGGTLFNLMGLVLFSTALGYSLFARGLQDVRAGVSSIILIIVEPAAAVVMAVIFLGENVTGYSLAGGALIVLAGAFIYLGRTRSPGGEGVVEG